MSLNQNSLIQLRKQCFLKNFERIRIKIRQDDSKIYFEDQEFVIQISCVNTKALPSASEELSSLLEELIKRISKKLPENVSLNFKAENESA